MTTLARIARRSLAAFAAASIAGAAAAVAQPDASPAGKTASPPARGAAHESSIPLGSAGSARSSPGATPASASPKSPASNVAQTVLALGGVLSVVAGGAFVLRRVAKRSGGLWSAAGPGGRSPAGIIEILGRYPLGRGQTLLLLRLDRRVLLVGQSGASRLSAPAMTTLSEIVEPEEVASILTKSRDAEEEKATARFTSLLKRFDGEHAAAAVPIVDVKPQRAAAAPAAVAPSALRSRLDSLRPAPVGARSGRVA